MSNNLVTNGNVITYHGAPIHDGSPLQDIRDALTAARTHPVPAVRDVLVHALSSRLTLATIEGHVPTSALQTGDVVFTGIGRVRLVSARKTHDGDVYSFSGRILDFDPANDADHRWIASVNAPHTAARPANDWTVQGNDYARWSRLTRAARPVSLVKDYA